MAFSYAVRLSDPSGLAGSQGAAILADLRYALASYSNYLTGSGTLNVTVRVVSTLGAPADAGPTVDTPTGTLDGRPLLTPSSIYELNTGTHAPGAVDSDGQVADIQVNLNGSLLSTFYIDPAPTAARVVPSDKFDLVSTFVHELAHGFGFTGLLNTATATFSSTTAAETLFDHYVSRAADGSLTFTGPNAMAAYGAAVPLFPANTGEAIYHFAGDADSWLRYDALTGNGMYNGKIYQLSPLDLAVLKDVGAPVTSLAGTAISTFSVKAGDASKAEGNSGTTPFTFTITRAGDTSTAATLTYLVGFPSSGSPADIYDFPSTVSGNTTTWSSPSGSVAFAAGDVSKTVTINVAGDTTQEPNETFNLYISGASNINITTSTANGLILNDDGAIVASSYAIAADVASKPEGNSGTTSFTFTVTRSGDSSAAATLAYAITGTGTNPASASDFADGALPSGSVAFVAGQTNATITAYVTGDTIVEPDETFTTTITSPAGASITTASATATITNDDTATAPATGPSVGFANGTTGKSGTATMEAVPAGSPSYLTSQYIYNGSDDIAISTQAPNVFIHSGSGNDAIQVTSGQNVLDGGLGSNFLTGGMGAGTDTFFTDARNPGVVWNTIRNFHQGDAATLWGFVSGVSSYRWETGVVGATGSEGATLRANIVGGNGRSGDGIDASITFTGMSVAQSKNLQIVTGTQPAGSYLYIYNPGV